MCGHASHAAWPAAPAQWRIPRLPPCHFAPPGCNRLPCRNSTTSWRPWPPCCPASPLPLPAWCWSARAAPASRRRCAGMNVAGYPEWQRRWHHAFLPPLCMRDARAVLHCQLPTLHRPLPQVLCGTERLLALGRRCGLQLQCHATTSAAGTAAVVDSVARAWLAKWQAGGPGQQYAVAEEATEEEAFLTRWVAAGLGWACFAGGRLAMRLQLRAGASWWPSANACPFAHPLPPPASPQVLLAQPPQRIPAAVAGPAAGPAAAPLGAQPAAGAAGAWLEQTKGPPVAS